MPFHTTIKLSWREIWLNLFLSWTKQSEWAKQANVVSEKVEKQG